MAETSIPWTHYTFNPWIGCVEVSPGCANCYAKKDTYPRVQRARGRELWGKDADRHVVSEAAWRRVLSWHRSAFTAQERRRVFCASLADVFEGHPLTAAPRRRLWGLIRRTPWLDWLLLTKRPQNITRLLLEDLGHIGRDPHDSETAAWIAAWLGQPRNPSTGFAGVLPAPPKNVWLGTTIEDQKRADERAPALLRVPALLHFASVEPLLEAVDLTRWCYPVHEDELGIGGARPYVAANVNGVEGHDPWVPGLDWLIVGGESGHHARPFNVEWARALHGTAQRSGTLFFMKQIGTRPMQQRMTSLSSSTRTADGSRVSLRILEGSITTSWNPTDAKGEALEDLPEDLRIRHVPCPRLPHA